MKQSSVITIRKNPVILVWNFIALELIGYAAFFAAGTAANYNLIYNQLFLSRILSYHAAKLTGILVVELFMTAFIFAKWFYEYYQIRRDSLLVARGLFRRRKTMIPLQEITSASSEYGILGRIFNYGNLILPRTSGRPDLHLSYVPMPQTYAALIMKLKRRNAVIEPRFERSELLRDIEALLAATESEYLEFKATLRFDLRTNQVNRQLEKAVMKSVAAFLNSAGGHLVIGVGDDRAVIGIGQDSHTLQHDGRDGFENHFTLVFNNMIGAEYRPLVRLHFVPVEKKEICIVEVSPSAKPAYVRFDNNEEFYVRTGNTTTSLKLSEAAKYINLWRARR